MMPSTAEKSTWLKFCEGACIKNCSQSEWTTAMLQRKVAQYSFTMMWQTDKYKISLGYPNLLHESASLAICSAVKKIKIFQLYCILQSHPVFQSTFNLCFLFFLIFRRLSLIYVSCYINPVLGFTSLETDGKGAKKTEAPHSFSTWLITSSGDPADSQFDIPRPGQNKRDLNRVLELVTDTLSFLCFILYAATTFDAFIHVVVHLFQRGLSS